MARSIKWWLWSVVALLGLGVILYVIGPVLFASVAYPLKYEDSLCKWSKEYGVDVHLEAAKIMAESTWNPNARSGAGAVGLTQFIPSTARRVYTTINGAEAGAKFNANQLIGNPDLAIQMGTFHLKELIDQYGGNLTKVLIAYNGGGGAVRLYEAGSPIKSTVGYAKRILAMRDAYIKIYGDFCARKAAGEFNVEPRRDSSLFTLDLNEFWKNFLFTQQIDQIEEQVAPIEDLWQNLLR
ncbi:MAG: transglycosylase SLT domain-containing protein [Candidatus Berkelbacteria bacterium]|nr:MAG: transglycosylase SLT domain-containing protein [Candidatus Berkelbacteria bacterium]QQG51887.1 MAG: transglycosylase SLT domain-containing protein [Candidatus Berkelbacteria bacterium]